MNYNNLKIAWRVFFKTKLFTVINVLGLSLGFAGFVLAYMYINHEKSYDAWNPDYENIYLVGLESAEGSSDLTPIGLGKAIQEEFPEIVEMGRVNRFPYEVPFHSDEDVFFIREWLGADASLAKIFKIKTSGANLDSIHSQTVFLRNDIAEKLFPDSANIHGAMVMMGNKSEGAGMPLQISGKADLSSIPSNMNFECIGFVPELGQGTPSGNDVETFIQVEPGTDINRLTAKVNTLFHGTIAKTYDHVNSSFAKSTVYLDPLKNLHLQPQHGSSVGYKIMLALSVLSIAILLLAGINFANLMVVQAQKRAKEIGMKKIFGVGRFRLIYQFLAEVFVQTAVAALFAVVLVNIGINVLVTNFGYDLNYFKVDATLIYQLFAAVVIISLVSGLYPAIVLTGNRAIQMIKGNYQSSYKNQPFRQILLTVQFVVAFGFISVMVVIHQQMDFMKKSDKGFHGDQVVYIKNLALFNEPEKFVSIRDRMKAIPGIEYVTVANSVPGGNPPNAFDFEYIDKKLKLNYTSVDYEYFEALGMDIIDGRGFSTAFPADSVNSVVLNETAVARLGIENPVGKMIQGMDTEFRVVGVVKDSKVLGFEKMVSPAVYSIKHVGLPLVSAKVEILAKIETAHTQAALRALAEEWSSINKLSGDYFIYEFVDMKFAALHAKQDQLHQAFTTFTVLIIWVALMGLFAMAAYNVSTRQKEVGIRKVLGASGGEILILLNKPFFKLILVALLISTPLAWYISSLWLQGFAYRVEIHWWYFLLSAFFLLLLAFLVVSYHARKAVTTNPVLALHEE
ncbi:ABC transporter permease [Albibacterium indicum]|uniref:ABC transporter permease n=1 Tax=Albibacterium indicum TaxID=2292082 RepID=UPI000E4F626E|nr:ABC transporter permease [Pedobacter indicus]